MPTATEAASAIASAAAKVAKGVVAAAGATRAAVTRTATGADRVPARARGRLRVVVAGHGVAVAHEPTWTALACEERVVERRVHARGATGERQSATGNEGSPQRVVGPEARRVEVVVADVEGGAAVGEDDAGAGARGPVHLVLVVEAGGREVADGGEGPWPGELGQRVWMRMRMRLLGLAAAEGAVRIARFLGAALGLSGLLGIAVVDLDVALALELGNELLDDVDLQVMENICIGDEVSPRISIVGSHRKDEGWK